MKRKILIFTDYFIPGFKAGGPVKSILNLSNIMSGDFDIYVVSRDKDFGDINPYDNISYDGFNIINNINIIYLSRVNIITINRAIKIIRPDVIYLNSFFSKMTQIVLLLKKIKLINSKIILAPRGELLPGAISLKSKKKKIFLSITKALALYGKDIIFHVTNKIESSNVKSLFSNKLIEIANLTNSENFQFINIEKQPNMLNIVFLSRVSKKKNLLYALEILQRIDSKNILFDIYGTKEDLKYWNKCEKLINTSHNIKISYKGSVKPADVAAILSGYQCFLLPTLDENFGHAIVEAMQMGVIPIISNQTPWNDLQNFKAGWAIDLNDKDGFIQAIKEIHGYNQKYFSKISKNAKNYIDKKLDTTRSVHMYQHMFSELIKK